MRKMSKQMAANKKMAVLAFILTLVLTMLAANDTKANPPANQKTKFYDFNDMLIDGQIKKPQALYIDHRQKVKFERLLRLKKSFMPQLLKTAKDPAFR